MDLDSKRLFSKPRNAVLMLVVARPFFPESSMRVPISLPVPDPATPYRLGLFGAGQ